MSFLVELVIAVLRALLPVLFERCEHRAEDSRRQPELGDRLRRRVRKTWGSTALALLMAAALLLSGCGTRTIYVPSGEPVRLRETVHRAKVWVKDANGQPVPGRMDLPEGWYVLPGEGD